MTGLSLGGVDKDGKTDLIAVDPSGTMRLYPGTGGSGGAAFATPQVLGNGWGPMQHIMLGDVNGDGWLDLVAVQDSTGNMLYYPGSVGFKFGAQYS